MRGLLFLLLIPIVAGAQTSPPNPHGPANTNGATYYVDAVNGNDSWAGTSPATAWKTLGKVQRSSFSPGDAILLMRGCVWREPLKPPSSGSSGSPITFSSYGSGAKPTINGSTVMTGWTLNTASIFQVTISYPAKVVVQDGTLLKYCPWNTNVATTFSGATAGSFSADGSTCYVWSTDGASPNSHTTEVAQFTGGNDDGIVINGKSYVTIDGLMSCNNSGNGIAYGENSSSGAGVIIRNCNAFFNGNSGIYVSCAGTIRNCLVTFDTVYQNKMHGIGFLQHITNSTISHSLVHDNSWDPNQHMIGIETWSVSSTNYVDSCIIEYNEVYGTGSGMPYTGSECAGIQMDNYTAHTNVRYNKIYNNAGWGLYHYGGTGNVFSYNVVYNNARGGFYGSGTVASPSMSLYNDTFYKNGGFGTTFGVIFTTAHGIGVMKNCIIAETATYEFYDYVAGHSTPDTIDNNLYYHPAGGQFLWWDAGSEIGYTSLSAFKAASGQDAHSLGVDPLFTNPATYNLSLRANSPCINAGVNLGFVRDFAGNSIVGLPDLGAYEYGGLGANAAVKVYLQGPYNTGTNAMNNLLRAGGVLAAHFGSMPIPFGAVDSINVEVRDSLAGAKATKRVFAPAWLMTDGTIRNFADTTKSYVGLTGAPAGNYYIVISHRNHLSVMSSSLVGLDAGTSPVVYDFSTGQTQAWGTNAMKAVGTRYAMTGGDGTGDGGVDVLDRNLVWRVQNGTLGYLKGDFNLDGGIDILDLNLVWRPNNGSATQVP